MLESVGHRILLAAVCGVGLLLAGCQAGMAPGGGMGGMGGATLTDQGSGVPIAGTGPVPNAKAVPPPAANSGLTSYKVYNTTEQLCNRTCKAEARCVRHAFQPVSEINGYIAGQCQLYGRS
jgi:hypothetical protein